MSGLDTNTVTLAVHVCQGLNKKSEWVRYYTQQTHTDPLGFAQALILGHLYVGASSQLSLDIGVAVEPNESKSHLRMKIERIVNTSKILSYTLSSRQKSNVMCVS